MSSLTQDTKNSYKYIFELCSSVATYHGYEFFGVDYSGKCWGLIDAYKTYDKYGCSGNCTLNGEYGIGFNTSIFIYHLNNGRCDLMYSIVVWKRLDDLERLSPFPLDIPLLFPTCAPVISQDVPWKKVPTI